MMMRMSQKVKKRVIVMKIGNGRTDASCATKLEAYFAVMDARK